MKSFCFVQLYHISERGGGAEVQSAYLAEYLAAENYDVHYICKSDKVKEVTSKVIKAVNVYMIPNYDGLSKANFENIYNLLLEIKPDFIIERMSSSFGKPILKAKKIINAKYIWICTDNESPLKFKTVINYYNKLSLLKFLIVFFKALKTDLIRIKAIQNADYVFSQNNIQKQLIVDNFKRDSFRMISGHPVPQEIISTKERIENKLVLWCANLGKNKRPELFIELAQELEKQKIECVMVGSHANKEYVKNLFKNKPGNIKVTGQLSFEDSLKWFNKATVFVNTSISEGFSNTYIQSWLRGVPVVLFGADPSNIVKKELLGFDVKNIDEAIVKIDSLFSDSDYYGEVSNHLKVYANNNHSIKKMADNFLKNF